MKNKYEKPMLEVIPFELNEAIASGCGLKVYNHQEGTCATTAEWKELESMMQVNLTEDISCSSPLKGYCYYTSNGTGTFLFNS